jgi:hypothetical protein
LTVIGMSDERLPTETVDRDVPDGKADSTNHRNQCADQASRHSDEEKNDGFVHVFVWIGLWFAWENSQPDANETRGGTAIQNYSNRPENS